MNTKSLRELLAGVQAGQITVDQALEQLKSWPYEDLGFAKLDHHRHLRNGFPEVIFCPGKTVEQIVSIMQRMSAAHNNVLATRASAEVFAAVQAVIPEAEYHELARLIIVRRQVTPPRGKVLVISAGTADLAVAEEARLTAELLGCGVDCLYDVGVAGIHRLFDQWQKLQAAQVIVVVAGMEGALASVVGGLVDRPVIAVPTSVGYGANFGGLSALLGMLNSCAAGVGVVNIDNGFGAAVLAWSITRVNLPE
ncbi:MAG: nickel pincer cofactor biosynthesis protein LarB [Firmicutes bacterium]|nr:nickel pincer cofactor biosynthesis protein LarB [Bacillota bacterium]